MPDENDWRLSNQERYLQGQVLRRKRYRPASSENDHDHCEFCWAKFMEGDRAETLQEGYATLDGNRWICIPCFEDFKDLFHWRLA
jgi:hypothetical protein